MKPRRCFDCGARAADGADVRECDECTFGVCDEHGTDNGGVRVCDYCATIPGTPLRKGHLSFMVALVGILCILIAAVVMAIIR